MPDKAVWKTSHTDALAKWDEAQEALDRWTDDYNAVREETGLDGWMVTSDRVMGPAKVDSLDDDGNPPDGWRALKTIDYLKPATGKKGDEARAILKRLNPKIGPDFMSDLLGVPRYAFAGLNMLSPGFERHGDTIYVLYGRECEPWPPEKPNPWFERCPLSEFYAAKEAADAQA